MRFSLRSKLGVADWIQVSIFSAMFLSVLFMGFQTHLQNRLLGAQLLRDRLELYWRTYDPVSDGHVQAFREFPEDYFITSQDYASRYADAPPEVIRRHIQMAMLYEYLAFTHNLESQGIGDPLGNDWMERWTLHHVTDPEFLKVHENYRGFYPKFERFVDELKSGVKAQGG